jgi:hypothetical protein
MVVICYPIFVYVRSCAKFGQLIFAALFNRRIRDSLATLLAPLVKCDLFLPTATADRLVTLPREARPIKIQTLISTLPRRGKGELSSNELAAGRSLSLELVRRFRPVFLAVPARWSADSAAAIPPQHLRIPPNSFVKPTLPVSPLAGGICRQIPLTP